ncbi:MAG TPA: hypothetical protein VF834_08990 [Streptosporangiaceae bacterium]
MATNRKSGLPDIDLAAPLSTDQDVIRRVDHLLRQDSRRQRSILLLFLSADGVQLPVVVPIDDVPERPDELLVENLCGVIAQVLDDVAEAGSAVIALVRPGSEIVDECDRRWFRALHASAHVRGAAIRMICLATEAGLRQLTLDDAG